MTWYDISKWILRLPQTAAQTKMQCALQANSVWRLLVQVWGHPVMGRAQHSSLLVSGWAAFWFLKNL